MAELEPGAPSFVDRLLNGSITRARRTTAATRGEVVDLVLRGGYPIAVGLSTRARRRWFINLAALVVERLSVEEPDARRVTTAARFLTLLASRTAQVVSAADIGREMALGRDAAAAQLRLMELVYLVVLLPAWPTNLSARVTKRPKLHLVDSGLAAALQGMGERGVSSIDPAAASRFGALLETFVTMEVVKQTGWAEEDVELSHFRTSDGIEVDLVLETRDGRVAAVEVKAGERPGRDSTRGLEYLRDRVGERFVAGVVLTTGSHAQRIGDRLAVAPIDSLWRE